MTSTVAGIIAWPVIIFMSIVVTARFRWCNTNLYDTYFNNTLGLVLVAQVLREHQVENVLSRSDLMTPTAAQQLAFAAMVFASSEFIGFIIWRSGLSQEETRRRHRYYRLGAVILSAMFLAAATRARVAGQTLEVSGGWDGVLAWSLYMTMLFVVSAQIISMSVSELRTFTHRRELLVALALLLLGASIATVCSEALILPLTDQLGWTTTVGFRLWFHGFEFFFEAFFLCLIGAIPLAVKLLSYLGLDHTSRTWHKLQPLRQSMLTVVPVSSFDIEHDDHRFRKTTLQLHQTVIEIRDAMLQLRPYFRETAPDDLVRFFEAYSVPNVERDGATHALRLAHAAKTKTAGTAPEPSDKALTMGSRSTTLDEEAADLLKLANWWQAAYAATGLFTHSARDVKVSTPA